MAAGGIASPTTRREEVEDEGDGVLCLIVTALFGTNAVADASSAAGDQKRVIWLLSVQQGGSLIDVDRSGGDGPTLGDQYIFTDGLYEWHGTKRGKRIGKTHGIATITSPTTAFFTGTMSLPGEVFEGAGYFNFTGHVETIIVSAEQASTATPAAKSRSRSSAVRTPKTHRSSFVSLGKAPLAADAVLV